MAVNDTELLSHLAQRRHRLIAYLVEMRG